MNDPRTDKVGPVDHILRAVLPWRTEADLTECGKPVARYEGRLVTRDEAVARIERVGKLRAAYTLCMTCAGTVNRHHRWRGRAPDAAAVLARALAWTQYADPPFDDDAVSSRWVERQRLNTELDAIAALVAEHRAEFDGYLAGRAETASLDDRRLRRRRAGR